VEATLGLLADYANVTAEGKLNIMGVFQFVNVQTFPAVHGQMFLVLTLEAPLAEAGMKKQLTLKLMTEDGPELFTINQEMQLPKANADPRLRGAPITVNHIIGFQGLRFDKPGTYQFAVLVGGETKKTVPLRIIAMQPPQKA
jgi:hypothetical protein